MAQSRIYLNYHTPKQVYVGSIAGVSCAIAWFLVTSLARQFGLVEWLLEQPLVQWARMRDLVVSESLEDAGWERWRTIVQRRREVGGKKRN